MKSTYILILALLFVPPSHTSATELSDDTGDPFASFGIDDLEVQEPKSLSQLTISEADQQGLQISAEVTTSVANAPERENINYSKTRLTTFVKADRQWNDELRTHLSYSGFYDYAYEGNEDIAFDPQTLDEYEFQSEVYEAYVSYMLNDNFQAKVGRQVIVWGNTEIDRVLDVVTPLDLREVGTKDIGEQRLPVTSLRLLGYLNGWQTEFVVLPEIRPDRLGTRDSGFDPFASARDSGYSLLETSDPDNDYSNPEKALRLNRSFYNLDLSLVAADVFDDTPYLDFEELNNNQVVVQPTYNRVNVSGLGLNYVSGSLLYKAEATEVSNKNLARVDVAEQIMMGNSTPSTYYQDDIYRYMLGLEYTGISNLFVTFEYIAQKIQNYQPFLDAPETSKTYGMVMRYKALNEKLNFTLTTLQNTDNGRGNFARFETRYSFSDSLYLRLSHSRFDSSDNRNPVYNFRNSDRTEISISRYF